MNSESVSMQLIVHSGDARSKAMGAIYAAKKGSFAQARAMLSDAEEALGQAHKIQASLIQDEAEGKKAELSILLMHAQDHLMNAITVKELAGEMVDLYEAIKNAEREEK